MCELCGTVPSRPFSVYGRKHDKPHNMIDLCRECRDGAKDGRIKQVVLFNKIAERMNK